MSTDKGVLIKWILRRHGDVTKGGEAVTDFDALDVDSVKAEVLIGCVERGGCIDIDDLLKVSRGDVPPASPLCERGRPKRMFVDVQQATSEKQPSSASSHKSETASPSSAPSPRFLSHPTCLSFPPVLLRRPILSDVRPFHIHDKPLSLLKDKMVSSLTRRTRLVYLAGYEYALISNKLNSRRVMEIETALELPSVVVKGIIAMLKQCGDVKPAIEVLSTLTWRLQCLEASVKCSEKAVAAFGNCADALRDWRVCSILVIMDSLEGDRTELCSQLLGLAMENKSYAEWEMPLADLRAMVRADTLITSNVAIELYAGILTLFMSSTEEDPIDPEDLYEILGPLRDMWGISTFTHLVVKSTIAVELLTIEGSKDMSTQNALCHMVELFPKRTQDMNPSESSWCLPCVASVIGRLYQMFIVPSFTTQSANIRDLVLCCSNLGDQYIYSDLEPYLNAVFATIGPCSPFTFDDTDISCTARDIINNGLWFGVTTNWKSLLKSCRSQLEEDLAKPTVRKLSSVLASGDVPPDEVVVPPVVLAVGILKKLPGELKKHLPLLASTNSQQLRSVATAAYFTLMIDLLVEDKDYELDLTEGEAVHLLRSVKDLAQHYPASKSLISTLSRLSPLLMKSAKKRVTQLQEGMADFVDNAMRRADWRVSQGEKYVLPEVIDCFACFNDNMQVVAEFFFPGAAVFAKGIVQCVSGSTQSLTEQISRRFLMPSHTEGSLEGLMMLRTDGSLEHAVIALNSLISVEDEFTKAVNLFLDSWSAFSPLLGEEGINASQQMKGTLAFIASKKDEVTRYVAAVMTYGSQVEAWTESLYAIDMKHYKKYKHDKKYLLRNGASRHLVHSGPSVRDMLNTVDKGMSASLPNILLPAVRLNVLEYSFKMWCVLYEWVLLGDSSTEKHGRYFHEDHSPALIEDVTHIEGFYNAGGTGLPYTDLKKHIGRIKLIIQMVMSRPTEELLEGGTLCLPYSNLPEDDPVRPATRKVVRDALLHRKDQAAKKFTKKLSK